MKILNCKSILFCLMVMLSFVGCNPCGENDEDVVSLGVMTPFFKYTGVTDKTLVSESRMVRIPEWLTQTDFPYSKGSFETEGAHVNGISTVRILGGWGKGTLYALDAADPGSGHHDLVYRNKETGKLEYRWNLLKARLDPYVGRAYEITMVMDNVPYCLPNKPIMGTYGQAAPPSDFDEWYTFIRDMCREIKRLYGEDIDKSLRFRMGTEMQDERRFNGSFEEYLKYYDYAAKAVKEELPEAKFGPFNRSMPKGNYTTFNGLVQGNVGILKVAEHCANGKNYATGEPGSPFDFLARSFYYFSSEPEPGKLINIQPSERVPEMKRLWDEVESISPKYKNLSREIHEYGAHLETEQKLYGFDTGARGAAQNFHTIVDLLEVGLDRLWHWDLIQEIDQEHTLIGSQMWLYNILDRMIGGKAFALPVLANDENGNLQKSLLSVKNNEAILIVCNWNIDRTLHETNDLEVFIPSTILSTDYKATGMVAFNRSTSVYDVIREDIADAGLLNEIQLKHRGEPATKVFGTNRSGMTSNREEGLALLKENWHKYQGLMEASLTEQPFTGGSKSNKKGIKISISAECPSVKVIVLRKED